VLAFLTDENFKGDIVRGLRHQRPELDLVRVQEVGLSGADDEVILERAAQESRLLLTHDVKTVTRYAYERAGAALPMPGAEVSASTTSLATREDILLSPRSARRALLRYSLSLLCSAVVSLERCLQPPFLLCLPLLGIGESGHIVRLAPAK
jgi:uncharacterized protein DUF5615